MTYLYTIEYVFDINITFTNCSRIKIYCNFHKWSSRQQSDNRVGDDTDGFFFGYNTETSVLSIKNIDTFQSKLNKVGVRPLFNSISVKGNNSVIMKMLLNATLGGTPVWTDINANYSVVQYDTSATTVSNGTLIAVIEIEPSGGRDFLYDSANFILSPGNVLTFSATSSSNAQVFQSVSWQELW